MNTFGCLTELRSFQKRHLPYLLTLIEFDIVRVVGLHQERAEAMMLKQLFLEEIGSRSSVQRSLTRLRIIGVVMATPAADDARAVTLTLAPEVLLDYAQYGAILARPAA